MLDPIISTAFAVHNGKGVYALLLGSGISRAANIPTGWEVTLDLLRRIAKMRDETEECDADPEGWYRDTFGSDPSYSELLEQLAISQSERTTALARYFEPTGSDEEAGVKPTAAHVAIAKMVKRGYFRVILTTNFDRLLERALETEGVSPSILSTPDAINGSMPLVHTSCTIIKLHGDYRDGRLRNTVAELSSYDDITNRLLERVLDDYGLIVSGWSATWDLALRDAILRAPNRRFTTMWSHIGAPSPEAAEIIRARSALRIQISSADSFFTNIEEKLQSLETLDTPHPLSVELAVRATKRYVVEDRFRVQLYDLLMAETDVVISTVEKLPVNSEISPDLYLERVAIFESIMQRLIPVMVNLAYWGGPDVTRLIQIVVERLMHLGDVSAGTVLWLSLRSYPAALVYYAVGLTLLAGDRLEEFRCIVRDFRTSAADLNEKVGPSLPRLALQRILSKDVLNHGLSQKMYVPQSERVHKLLAPIFAKQLSGVANFDSLFDRFEFVCSLIVTDMSMESELLPSPKTYVPLCSWFGRWVYRNPLGNDVSSVIKDERERLGKEWGLIKLGVFGSIERFDEVYTRHRESCAANTPYW